MAAEKNSTNPTTEVQNPVQVFCRLKPLQSSANIPTAEIKNVTTVLFPVNGTGVPTKPIGNADQETYYMFKQVFDEGASQEDIFNVTARPLVERLICGSNSLLFSYGVTGSGKTYTMIGVENQCGILPRCLKTLFRTIGGYNAPRGTFQTDHLNGFEIVNEPETMRPKSRVILRRKNSQPDINLESIGPVSPVSGINKQNIYAVFVSYVEIYNNSVYDLLENSAPQKVLQSRIVREDCDHNMYIHGATELEITTVEDAIDVLLMGQKRKRMAQTALNVESSRSHAIFNIRLVQAPAKQHAGDVDKNFITISQLSLVDLAGTERSSRTKNTGERLRETGKINNSLMKLRECFEYLRENQKGLMGSNTIKKIPYRDSKLTYLFKNFFEGEGQISMIVCVNPNINDSVENAHVLKFAEMTQEVQILNTKPSAPNTARKRQAWNTNQTEQFDEIVKTPRLSTKTKVKPLSCIKRPNQYMENLNPAAKELNCDFEFQQKKIYFLEKQNFALRLELTRIRDAYEKITGHPWENDIVERKKAKIFGTERKPLLPKQKSNIADNKIQQKNVKTQFTAPNGSFLAELQLRLEEQRKKLEESFLNMKTAKNAKSSLIFDSEFHYDKENNERQEINSSVLQQDNWSLQVNTSKTAFSMDSLESNLNNTTVKNSSAIEEASFSSVQSKKYKFEEYIQMELVASLQFQTSTPKIQERTNTPKKDTESKAKKRLEFFNENVAPLTCKSESKKFFIIKDPEFDKRERELTLKIAMHRQNQLKDKYLTDILCTARRSKRTSTDLDFESKARKKLFAEKQSPSAHSNAELREI